MSNLRNYAGRPLKSAEDASIKLDDELSEEEKKAKEEADAKAAEEKGEEKSDGKGLSDAEVTQFCGKGADIAQTDTVNPIHSQKKILIAI
jgi:hypothetical protein